MIVPEPTAADMAASVEEFAESLDCQERYVPAEWCRLWFRRAVAAEESLHLCEDVRPGA